MLERPILPIGEPNLTRQKLALRLAFLVIIMVSVLAFYTTQQLISAIHRVEKAQTVLTETTSYLAEVTGVESATRGYLITGDERYVRSHSRSSQLAEATADRLRRIEEAPLLEERLDAMISVGNRRVELSRDVVARRGSPAESSAFVMAGTEAMDRLKQHAKAIIADESEIYRSQRAALERQAWFTSLALAGGVALCLVFIAWLFGLRGRELRRRRQLEDELRAVNVALEDRVEERTAELARARHLLDAVVENLPDMILLKEPSGGGGGYRYVLVNAAGEKLLGRDRSEIIGTTERDVFPPGEAEKIIETCKEVGESGKPRFFERKLTTALGVRAVESRIVPVPSNGGPPLILGIIRDVTDAKLREDQLRMLQRMDAVGRLTGGVAHDFNNLLAIIHGNSELLLNICGKQPDAKEMIEDVISASARGAELVRRLLAFARMQHLEPETVDLNAHLPDMVSLLQRALGENIIVRLALADGLWPATVDPTQVDDALVNLAINARDAMPRGGTLTIETRNVFLDDDYAADHAEVGPGQYVMLAVSDTGTGMSAEVLERAFEPFFTTKEEAQGSGLGLSQIFGWVKQSGGHIKIYSELGHGTIVKLYLPRAEGSSAEKAAELENAAPTGDETILVVEDNDNVRRTVIRQLHDLGYETVEAENGARALELVGSGLDFDLLLTDVVMPGGITGYDLAEQLRAGRPDLKVLFTSGYTELAAASDLSTGGALLSKPYRKQDLGRAVRCALDTPQ